MSDIILIEETHTYLVDGERYPSTTQVISDAGLTDFSMVSPDIMERACQWGNAVHAMSDYWLRGVLNEDDLDPALQGPLNALKKWLIEHYAYFAGDPIVEKFGKHKKLRYCGKPDIVFPDVIIEIKSRKVNMLTDPIQLASYDNLDGNGKRKRYVLELKMDGTYVYTRVNPTRKVSDLAWSRFRYLLDLYYMKREVEKWK